MICYISLIFVRFPGFLPIHHTSIWQKSLLVAVNGTVHFLCVGGLFIFEDLGFFQGSYQVLDKTPKAYYPLYSLSVSLRAP